MMQLIELKRKDPKRCFVEKRLAPASRPAAVSALAALATLASSLSFICPLLLTQTAAGVLLTCLLLTSIHPQLPFWPPIRVPGGAFSA
jgi:hypothetical protein